jgi:uncharacterized membrane protein
MIKSKGQTIQWSKVKDKQYNDQKKKTNNTMNKSNPFLLIIVLFVLYFWSLYCVSFTFGHCIVCLLLLIIVLFVLYFWSLYCVSFTFGHCIVCLLLLSIVLCVLYFWSLYCLSFTFDLFIVCSHNTMIKSKGHMIQWPKVKDTQYNDQK